MRKPHVSSEEGQSIVLIALAMVALVAMAGLVIDGGRDYEARRVSQNASDAAAFAGVRVFTTRSDNSATSEQKILNAVNSFALRNGVASTSDVRAYFLDSSNTPSTLPVGSNGGIQSSWTGIRVYTTIRFIPFLISVITGGNEVNTTTFASAQSGTAGSMENLMPMTLCEVGSGQICLGTDFQFDVSYQLFGDVTGPGGFQWLSFDCASSNTDLVDYLDLPAHKSSGVVSVGDNVCTGPGVQNSNDVNQALQKWISQLTPENRYWVIPVHDYTTETGTNLKYHIVAFAVFEFEAWNFNGSNKYVQGKFRRFGRLGHVTTPGSCNQTVFDTCAISLYE